MLDGWRQLQLKRSVLEGRVVGRPRDDRKSDVVRQLHEVLRRHRLAAVVLAVRQVQDGRGPVG